MQCIYAHRGASGYAPENTLEAFELAAKQHAYGVELDVHLTRDGQVIVAHDDWIDRVSDGTGRIIDLTLAELKRHRFNKTFPEYKNATAPLLAEVYELLEPTGLCVNVELKNNLTEYPGLEKMCIELAARMGMTERVLYSSFNHQSLMAVKAIDSSIPCGLLYSSSMVRPWDYAHGLGMNALHCHFSEVYTNRDECERAHALGIEVNPWTVNDEDDLRRVIGAGCDRIITNYPDRALALLAESRQA